MTTTRQPRFSGLVAAPFTPFHGDGTLAEDVIERQCEKLVADGVRGAFVCGTTGEGPSLTMAERMRVAARWVTAARGRLRVLVHTGHTAVDEARQLAAHAQAIGADGVGCLAPYFFRPASIPDLAGFCGRVAAAAPALPFYYYHIPSMTGVAFPMRDFMPLAAKTIPNFAGIKYTFEDLADFAACARFDGGAYEMFFGRDELLLEGLAAGATGAIGSTYNYMAGLYHPLIAAHGAGDDMVARACQERVRRIIDVMIRHGGLPAGKRMMGLVGIDCGPVRPPLATLDAAAAAILETELAAAGFERS